MVFDGGAKNQDVVHVSQTRGIVEISEDPIHHSHECSWGIAEAKRKDFEFEVAVSGTKRRFILVVGMDQDVVIPIAEIELGKMLSAGKSVLHFFDVRNGSTVFDGCGVEATVVDAEA